MSIQLPNMYLPEEWDELSDEQREASARLEAWFCADSARICAQLEALEAEVNRYPGPLLDQVVRARCLHLMAEEDALERLQDAIEAEEHDVD